MKSRNIIKIENTKLEDLKLKIKDELVSELELSNRITSLEEKIKILENFREKVIFGILVAIIAGIILKYFL